MTGTHDNENEPLTFHRIGLHAALVMNKLRNAQQLRELEATEEQEEDRSGQPHAGRTDETKAREHREAVDHGLRNLAKWEQRIRDGKMRVKRR